MYTTSTKLSLDDIDALIHGRYDDPFSVLGKHVVEDDDADAVVRAFVPGIDKVFVIGKDGSRFAMNRLHDAGLFEVNVPLYPTEYMLELHLHGKVQLVFDAYCFQTLLGDVDHHLLSEGNHTQLYRKLGSHVVNISGVEGVMFAVWAPSARLCSVIGDFNDWDERRHVMRKHHNSGIWEIFIPIAGAGTKYKYVLRDHNGEMLPHKNDPYAHYYEAPPGNASIVFASSFQWSDTQWLEQGRGALLFEDAITIYEVHLPSWRHGFHGEQYSYRELAEHLIPYAVDNGFTHIELMPVSEHPFAGSWGYQPIGLFAPTQRLGTPDDFRYFVDRCHQAGLAVIMDWVPAHFPGDAHGLAKFDGTHLYEHADPRQGKHKDWDTLIYNFGRKEVSNYLLCNALYWIREFHLDGLRVDAVASMLYLDYSRQEGEWIPNEHGGNHNLEAVSFLQQLNTLIHREGAITMAEESTSWDGVTRPVFDNGLGFTYKWNMGWMHDMLEYMGMDPIHRQHHHERLTFGQLYAFSENFVLPFSHDEVVYGKRSMIGKMPGDTWQAHAGLRCLYGFMYAYPGKKLMFMGCEFAQESEWSHDGQLDWQALENPLKQHCLGWVRTLNFLYREEPALHKGDTDIRGFQWIDCDDAQKSVVAFYRRVPGSAESIIVVCNFTPVVYEHHRIGVYDEGRYREVLNSDDLSFGGSGVVNSGVLQSEPIAAQGKDFSLEIRLPPLATLFIKRQP